MKEKWRDIPGYEGEYSVSSFGRVKSLKRVVQRKVLCVETKEVYRSLGEAYRKTAVPMHILFNRLKTGRQDNNGHHWVYVVN